MTQQKLIPAHATFSRVETITPVVKSILKSKILAIEKGILIPDNLIAEIDSFCKRNNLISIPQNETHTSCPDCLKAHALKRATALGLDPQSISFLSIMLNGKIGHNGYYLDGERLIRI